MENQTNNPRQFSKRIVALREQLEQLSREPNNASRLREARRLMLELNRAELLNQASRRPSGTQDRSASPVAPKK